MNVMMQTAKKASGIGRESSGAKRRKKWPPRAVLFSPGPHTPSIIRKEKKVVGNGLAHFIKSCLTVAKSSACFLSTGQGT